MHQRRSRGRVDLILGSADEVPARGTIPDELWWEAVRALRDRVRADKGLPLKMCAEMAMLALHVHPCTGKPYPDTHESRSA